MDKIYIKGLEVFAHHGVFKEENVLGQKFVVSAVISCDTHNAGKNDKLESSVNYAEVCKLISEEMKTHTFKLIEAVAECLAEKILLKYDLVKEVTIKIEKPSAPILMSLDTVAVEITRKWHRAYISAGSNIGDKTNHLTEAVKELSENDKCRVCKTSGFVITKPVGDVQQDDFLNACIEIETLYTPYELLEYLNTIEKKHKRERKIHWGPRTLDLDIIFYDDLIMYDEDLIIPHKEAEKREFVLAPLCEIAPYFKNPLNGKTVLETLRELSE